MTTITKDIISGLSIAELKQMLARVNHDLKMNKPTIKRQPKVIIPVVSEASICNQYAAKYTGGKALSPAINSRLIADIQIQKDILSFIDNGGMIITKRTRVTKRNKKVALNPLTLSYYKKVSL